jgi:hypothetical protein
MPLSAIRRIISQFGAISSGNGFWQTTYQQRLISIFNHLIIDPNHS